MRSTVRRPGADPYFRPDPGRLSRGRHLPDRTPGSLRARRAETAWSAGVAGSRIASKMDEPSIGPCALCGTVGPLKLSHIIPRWMYRRLLHTSPTTVSSLILVDPNTRSATFSSKQDRERLLCGK